MARTPRRGTPQQEHLPQLVVTAASAIVFGTGAWLWFLGESQTVRQTSGDLGALGDPDTVLRWILRIHVGAGVAAAIVIAGMLVHAVATPDRWRLVYLALFAVFLGLGFWTGYVVEWDPARLWASTTGSELAVLVNLDDSPDLPDELFRARAHMAILPAAMAIVALAAVWHRGRG